MKRIYLRFRVLLLTLALGLASVPFVHYLSDRWNQIPVDLPQVQSETPFYVFPKTVLTQQIVNARRLISQERNLASYDFGGNHSDCHWIEDSEYRKCETNLIKARKFLFQHWQEKKRAYLVVTFSSVDSSTDVDIYIEPDENGNWHSVWIEDYRGLSLRGNENLFAVEFESLGYKRATKADYEFASGTNYLSFTSANGEEIENF